MCILFTAYVKHHDKYAIIQISEISFENYNNGIIENSKDPYFRAKSKQEQLANFDFLNIKRNEVVNMKFFKQKRISDNQEIERQYNRKKFQIKYSDYFVRTLLKEYCS